MIYTKNANRPALIICFMQTIGAIFWSKKIK